MILVCKQAFKIGCLVCMAALPYFHSVIFVKWYSTKSYILNTYFHVDRREKKWILDLLTNSMILFYFCSFPFPFTWMQVP